MNIPIAIPAMQLLQLSTEKITHLHYLIEISMTVLIGDEDIVVEALDVLQECVEMEQPLINDHVEVTVYFTYNLSSSSVENTSTCDFFFCLFFIVIFLKPIVDTSLFCLKSHRHWYPF